MNRNHGTFVCLLAFLYSSLAFAVPGLTTYQARIIKPDNQPLEASAVNFRFTILNPNANCILYIEDYSAINMNNTSGMASFSLGSGTKIYSPASGTTFADVFNNSSPPFLCQGGGGASFTAAVNDVRKIVMQFNDGGGWQTLPAMSINAVPYAMYATKADNSVLFNNKADTAFVQYSSIPTCTASQALQYTGSGFVCITAGGGGGGGSSYTVTAGDITSALGYTPVNPASLSTSYTTQASFSTVTASVNSLGSSVTAVTSTVNGLTSSLAAIVSSQWTNVASGINYSSGSVGIGTATPVTKLDVSGGVRIGSESATCAPALAGTLRYSSGNVEYCNGTSWSAFGVSGAGITGFNGSTSGTQSLANGTAGTTPAFVTANGVHTLNIPLASAASVTAGLISNVDYVSFSNKITSSAASVAQVLGYVPANATSVTTLSSNVSSLGSSYSALAASMTTLSNIPIYVNANSSIFVGSGTTRTSTTANNTTLGENTLKSITTAVKNVAIGSNAMSNTTFGSANVAVGHYSLSSNTIGDYNTAVGHLSMNYNVDGWSNTALGSWALYRNVDGWYNTAVGDSSLDRVASGTENVAFGALAGRAVISGQGNTFIGTQSGEGQGPTSSNVSGSTFVGYLTGHNILTGGDGNTLIGYRTGEQITTGSRNIAIGFNIDTTSPTVSNSLNIGNLIFGTNVNGQDTTLSTGNIGIGTTTPVTKLDVSGAIRISMDSATCAAGYAGTLRYNLGSIEFCNGSTWSALGVSGAGLQSLNGSTSGTQSFANGTTGTSPAFVTVNGVHTFNIPLASAGAVTAGLISNADYVSFSNKITSSAASVAQALGYVPASATAAGNYLVKTNDLSDLTSSATARTNLGLGTFATASSIDLGSASATGTLADARLMNVTNVTSGSQYTKVTVDGKGRVTSGAQLSATDVSTALGYAPVSSAAASQWNTSGTTINYIAGNVGIGTSSPTSLLTVNGSVAFLNGSGTNLGSIFNNSGALNLQANSGSTGLQVGTSGANPTSFYTNGVTRASIDAAGNFGIGTTTPITKLEVSGGVRISMESATCAASYAGTLRYNSGSVEFCNGTTWSAFGVSGAGLQSLNGSTSGTQSFANGTAGNTPAFNTLNGVHTLNIPLASAAGSVTAGLISNADYVNFNNKMTSSTASIAQVLGYTPASATALGSYLVKTNNLSDLASSATARTNLGLGTLATANSIDLGSASATGTLAAARLPAFSGDATSVSGSNTLTLVNSGVSAATYTKVTVNAKGLVTSGAQLSTADVTTALGYTPASASASSQWSTSGTSVYYNSGNVGIGVTNPVGILEVDGGINPASPKNILLKASAVAGGAGNGGDIILTAGNTTAGGYTGGNITLTAGQGFGGNGAITLATTAGIGGSMAVGGDINLAPGVGNSAYGNVILVAAGGKTGIGTTTPVTKLEVSGGVKISMESATCATSYAGTLRYNAGTVQFCNGTAWTSFDVAGSSIQSLNGSTSGTQTFAIGTTGTAPAFVTANGVHTLNIPLASASSVTAGLLSKADYTTFMGKITSSAASVAEVLGYVPASATAGASYLVKTNNLSDLSSSATARTNLGLGTFATASTVDLGSASATGTLAAARLPAFAGDATSVSGSNTLTLANSGVSAATYTKVTVNAKGLVTSGTQLVSADITTALGFAPVSASASSQWNTSGTTINYMTGNVGIGASAPTARLSIESTGVPGIQMKTVGAAAIDTINMVNDMNATGYFWIAKGSTGNAAPTSANRLIGMTNEGNVEIYGQKINATDKSGILALKTQASGDGGTRNEVSMEFYADRTDLNTSSGYIGFESGTSFDLSLINNKSGKLYLGTNGSADMTIASTGNVGILTTSPVVAMDVSGAIRVSMDNATCATSYAGAIRYNAGTVQFCNGTSWGSMSGSVTSSTVISALGYAPVSSSAATQWATSGTAINYATGNVGIGVATPATKLDISGAIRIAMDAASCSASYAGAIRYNSGTVEFCNGTSWGSMSGSASATAAGSNRQVQFNASGTLTGSAGFTWDDSTRTLDVAHSTNSNYDLLLRPSGVYGQIYSQQIKINANNVIELGGGGSSTVHARIESNGNMGIGYVGANSRLVVKGAGTTSATSALSVTDSSDNVKFFVRNDGNVGIGTSSPVTALDVVGDIQYTGTITDVSDRRLKTNIEPINSALSTVRKIKTYSYVMKADPNARTEYGVMAQDMMGLIPQLVKSINMKGDYYGVNYMGLIPWSIRAIQEVDSETQNLRRENQEMKRELASIKEQNEKLNQKLEKILQMMEQQKDNEKKK